MNLKKDDIIEFKNGEYLIIDVITKDNDTFLYLINNDEFLNDVSITKVNYNNGKYEFNYIDSDSEFDYVMNKIFLDLKDDALDFVDNTSNI